MEIIRGVSASSGYIVGKAYLLDTQELLPRKRVIAPDEVDSEIERFRRAVENAKADVNESQAKLQDRARGDINPIFQSHVAMLDDHRMHEDVERRVRQYRFSAEFAVYRVMRRYIRVLRDMEDEYFSHRIVDLQDVEKRVLHRLIGERFEGLHNITEDVILVASDITPSQTVDLDSERIKGFVTDAGGRTSHTAIIARSLSVPAVVGLETATMDIGSGDTIIVDGTQGIVIIDPDKETQKKYDAMRRNLQTAIMRLTDLRDLPAETTDGFKITLFANAEFPSDVRTAISNGAEGIGLYRTEFIYSQMNTVPAEEDHLRAYQESLNFLGKRPITIRTLDLGADKMASETGLPEKNPFLGCRSIRFCLERPRAFKEQLRAILRASAYGDIRLLFPMISSREELVEAKSVVEEVKKDLDKSGIKYDRKMKTGIMVEVPSIAWTADMIVDDVDFMSIGTNDLVQYMLAVDRTNERVAHLYSPAHPAVLRALQHVINSCNEKNVPVAVCGEMSSEVEYTVLLLGLGLKEFSVGPSALAEVKKVIRSVSMAEAEELAAETIEFKNPKKASQFLRKSARKLIPEVF